MKTKQETRKDLSHMEKRICQRLRLFRNLASITQSEMAQVVGCTYQQYQKYENGLNRISVARLVKISQHLHIPFDAFIREEYKVAESSQNVISPKNTQILEVLVGLSEKKQNFILSMMQHLREL